MLPVSHDAKIKLISLFNIYTATLEKSYLHLAQSCRPLHCPTTGPRVHLRKLLEPAFESYRIHVPLLQQICQKAYI